MFRSFHCQHSNTAMTDDRTKSLMYGIYSAGAPHLPHYIHDEEACKKEEATQARQPCGREALVFRGSDLSRIMQLAIIWRSYPNQINISIKQAPLMGSLFLLEHFDQRNPTDSLICIIAASIFFWILKNFRHFLFLMAVIIADEECCNLNNVQQEVLYNSFHRKAKLLQTANFESPSTVQGNYIK